MSIFSFLKCFLSMYCFVQSNHKPLLGDLSFLLFLQLCKRLFTDLSVILFPVQFTKSGFKCYFTLFFFKGISSSFGSCCCHKPFFHSAALPRSEMHPSICSLKPEQMEESRREYLCQHKIALSFCGKCSPTATFNLR